MTPDDLTHVPPDVTDPGAPTTPPPDPRGVKFVAGTSEAVRIWMRDFLGIHQPNDVARVVINLEVGKAATVDVEMFLRSNALAALPTDAIGDVSIEPTPEQLEAATWAVSRLTGIRHADAQTLAAEVLKAAAPGPEQHPRP